MSVSGRRASCEIVRQERSEVKLYTHEASPHEDRVLQEPIGYVSVYLLQAF